MTKILEVSKNLRKKIQFFKISMATNRIALRPTENHDILNSLK